MVEAECKPDECGSVQACGVQRAPGLYTSMPLQKAKKVFLDSEAVKILLLGPEVQVWYFLQAESSTSSDFFRSDNLIDLKLL